MNQNFSKVNAESNISLFPVLRKLWQWGAVALDCYIIVR